MMQASSEPNRPPTVADREQWLTARRALLRREKELTRELDRLAAQRRELPMVRVEADYRFWDDDGDVALLDLFEGRDQLVIQHFMFDPAWDTGCGSCSAMAAGAAGPGVREHLARRGTSFAAVSRAPYASIRAYRQDQGWTFPWYSSYGSDFNYDYGVTLDPSVRPTTYNFRDADELAAAGEEWLTTYVGEQPGISTFLRVGDDVFHTYSTYGRGVEAMLPAYHLLDLTALGRQEPWELPADRAGTQYRVDAGVLSPERVGTD